MEVLGRLTQTSKPASEPVTLDLLKAHLRVSDDTEDFVILALAAAARQFAESYCGRSFVTQGWRLTLDGFPCGPIILPRGPVQSVQSITYEDMGGTTRTIVPAAPDYVVDLSGEWPCVAPGFGRVWPEALPQIASVRVNYTAGYGADGKVPEGIKHWILVRVNTLFENREEVAVLQRGSVSALPYVDTLLDPYRVIAA